MFYQGTVVRLRVSVGVGVRSPLFADAAVRFRSENENRQRFAIPNLVYLSAGGNFRCGDSCRTSRRGENRNSEYGMTCACAAMTSYRIACGLQTTCANFRIFSLRSKRSLSFSYHTLAGLFPLLPPSKVKCGRCFHTRARYPQRTRARDRAICSKTI